MHDIVRGLHVVFTYSYSGQDKQPQSSNSSNNGRDRNHYHRHDQSTPSFVVYFASMGNRGPSTQIWNVLC
jgi:hypothetical protein